MAATSSTQLKLKPFILIFVFIGLMLLKAQVSKSQVVGGDTCSSLLPNLRACGPFVVPGSPSPSTDCCTALEAVDRGCFCHAIQIASRLPAKCNLAPLNCGNGVIGSDVINN